MLGSLENYLSKLSVEEDSLDVNQPRAKKGLGFLDDYLTKVNEGNLVNIVNELTPIPVLN